MEGQAGCTDIQTTKITINIFNQARIRTRNPGRPLENEQYNFGWGVNDK